MARNTTSLVGGATFGNRRAMISGGQVRAARVWIGWSRRKLADKAEVAINTLIRFESGKTEPRRKTLIGIEQCLRRAGIVFRENDFEWIGRRKPPGQPKRKRR